MKMAKPAKTEPSTLLLIFIVALLAAGTVFAVLTFRSDPVERLLSGDNTVSVLFVIEDAGKPLSSYVLMYHPATKRAAVFDIPGSIGRLIPSINQVARLDSVYDPRRIAPFRTELQRLLGNDISFSFVITLKNLGELIDLMEGVEVFIPIQIDEYQDGYIRFPAGLNILDGDKSKLFITYELAEENDELINARRQHFFTRFIKRLGEQNEYLGNGAVQKVFHSRLYSETDRRSRIRLFSQLAEINTERITVQSPQGTVREISGEALIIPHHDGSLIQDVVRQTASRLTQTESDMVDRGFTVEILNGTGTAGLAGRTAELLRSFGYNVLTVANADRSDYSRTLIIDRSGYEQSAEAFGELIRCRNIRFDSPDFETTGTDFFDYNLERRSDFTLILGRDFNGRYVAN